MTFTIVDDITGEVISEHTDRMEAYHKVNDETGRQADAFAANSPDKRFIRNVDWYRSACTEWPYGRVYHKVGRNEMTVFMWSVRY